MNTLDLGRATQNRELQDDELDAVSGGTEGYPGLPLGTNINVSPWGLTTPFDLKWALVGATGHFDLLRRRDYFPAFVLFVALLSLWFSSSKTLRPSKKKDPKSPGSNANC
jgi:hypothetical protein